MIKIYYIANSRMPTIKAYGLQIAKTCEAFAKIGFGCELIVPKRHRYPNTGENNILEYYNIKTPFRVTELISPDLIDIDLGPFLNKFIFWIQQLFFAFSLKKYLAGREGMVYSRDQFALSVLSSKKFKLYWEAHNLPQNINSGFYRNILSKIKGLAVISEGLKNDFAEYYKGPMVVAPDAVDIEEFDIKISKENARQRLNLPLDKKIAIYIGHLYEWKGADLLFEVASKFQISNFKSQSNILFIFVGGTEYDISRFKKKSEEIGLINAVFLGYKSHNEIPQYLKAADCAILTGKKSESISGKYTSPLKMFEYMASGCPIVAQDLPSFREVLNEENSLIVSAEDSKALAEGINEVFNNAELAARISRKALEDVQKYTWPKRVRKIIRLFL